MAEAEGQLSKLLLSFDEILHRLKTKSLLLRSCRYLSDGNFIRVAHALETLTILLREIFKKRFTEQVRIDLSCQSARYPFTGLVVAGMLLAVPYKFTYLSCCLDCSPVRSDF